MKVSEKVIHLYTGPVPGSENWTHQEQENFSKVWQTQIVFNVVNPTLTLVSPEPDKANGSSVIICPGGGFYALSINSEGFEVARWLAAGGITCFVLKYRLVECKTDDAPTEMMSANAQTAEQARHTVIPLAVADARTAISYVRQHAVGYGIDPNRIGIIGFSAGGTTAASTAFQFTADNRPNFVAPIYLQYDWVTEHFGQSITSDAPPMFLLAATDDQIGLAMHSVRLYSDWIAAGKSAELHLYSKGGHGFGMRRQNLPSDRWIALFGDWLEVQGFLTR